MELGSCAQTGFGIGAHHTFQYVQGLEKTDVLAGSAHQQGATAFIAGKHVKHQCVVPTYGIMQYNYFILFAHGAKLVKKPYLCVVWN